MICLFCAASLLVLVVTPAWCQFFLLGEDTKPSLAGINNDAFKAAFAFEPWPRHRSHLFLGCFSSLSDEFSYTKFRSDLFHTLLTKKDEVLTYERCWRQCTFQRSEATYRNVINFVGVKNGGKMCICFNELHKYHLAAPLHSCSSKCTGVTGEFCGENTMLVYLVCYPGFYKPPYCEATCPGGVCMGAEFPDTQFEHFHIKACKVSNGQCHRRCLDHSGTKCSVKTRTCRVINTGNEEPLNMFRTNHLVYSYNDMKSLEEWSNSALSYVLLSDRKTSSLVHGAHIGVHLTKLTAPHENYGYAYFMTMEYLSTKNTNCEDYKVVYSAPLKGLGYARTDFFNFGQGMVNHNNEVLETWNKGWGEGSYIAFANANEFERTPGESYLFATHGSSELNSNYLRYNGYKNLNHTKDHIVQFESCKALSECRGDLVQTGAPYFKVYSFIEESFLCSPKCLEHRCTCDGKCLYGCAPGLTGQDCTTLCPIGYFGLFCHFQCSPGCKEGTCHHITGECTGGCVAKITGQYCTELCPRGFYGPKCDIQCSYNCLFDHKCDSEGACESGCKPGYQAPLCTEPCGAGSFGAGCGEPCGSCRGNKACDHMTGACPEGCSGEETPPNCKCPRGQWGPGCSLSCANCKEGLSCEGISGTCVRNATEEIERTKAALITALGEEKYEKIMNASLTDSGVQTMVQEEVRLRRQLDTSAFGVNLQPQGTGTSDVAKEGEEEELEVESALQVLIDFIQSSEKHKLVLNDEGSLDPNESFCVSPEFQSPQCVCALGFFGESCGTRCGNCLGVQCMQDDGDCLGECLPGYIRPFCIDHCLSGTWGEGCSQECGSCLGGVTCEPAKGSCSTGCAEGFEPPLCKGCAAGKWGPGCSTDCGKCKNAAACDVTSGMCPSGCSDDFQDPMCLCPRNFFGPPDCDKTCGRCRNQRGCLAESGACEDGCEPGFTGLFCNSTCPPGAHGADCAFQCGHCFNTTACHTTDGHCPKGCEGGFRPSKCICATKTFSDLCQPCGYCAQGTVCDPDTGECPMNCAPGFREPKCVCLNYKWGESCEHDCGNCATGEQCNVRTGECFTGCKIGYRGKQCRQVCDYGFYGANCSQVCGHCKGCQTCNPLSGECPSGCMPGYLPRKCIDTCPDGVWGSFCSKQCGKCINNQPCRKSDGKCLNGCKLGYRPPMCVEECFSHFYGANCQSICGECLYDMPCLKTDGTCPLGCVAGYIPPLCVEEYETVAVGGAKSDCLPNFYGPKCELACGFCLHDNCESTSGLCREGCEEGYRPLYCTQECLDGFYGINCKEQCGRCLHPEEVCRKTDGLCRSGCASGWLGRNCKFEVDRYYQLRESSASSLTPVFPVIWIVCASLKSLIM